MKYPKATIRKIHRGTTSNRFRSTGVSLYVLRTQRNSGYYITITLNKEQADNRPSLAVARTILHEAIHAEIYRKIKSTSPDISRVLVDISWPTLFDYYNEDRKKAQHNYMADYYRTAMEDGLKEYANLIGEKYPDQFYKDMAWSGLLNTKSWNNQYADKDYADKEKVRINKTIVNYEKSKTNECQ